MMKVDSYNPQKEEKEILKRWQEKQIYEKAKKKGEGKKKFYFLQGPPYTSGKLHIGHAWNNSLKDMVLRFKRMTGHDVWDRAGYDMHGLPTEHKVQALFNLKTKEDIKKFGLAKFAKECFKWSTEKMADMNKDLLRIGIWMDYENAYQPVTNEYMEGIWWLIKKAHEKKRLYEGKRTLSWCASCATALAKHEQEYKSVTENSIFVKFKVANKENEYLTIWTTTPWTIAFNLAIMANPEIEYVRCKVGDEVWICAKALAMFISAIAGQKYEVIEEFTGDKLEGMGYVHPWNDEYDHYKELKKNHPKVHTVIMSTEYVDTSAGTGLVHCAPGCGPEDYEVGHENNIPPFNTLTETGVYNDTMGKFSGWAAKKDDKKFIDELDKAGVLIGQSEVEHDYAHCERCHNPIVFRTTKQWFFKMEDLKPKMIKENQDIYWVPEAGKNAFHSWLDNLRDNSITKQRFWGTPIPVWKCRACGEYTVVGSIAELKEKADPATPVPENIHKPWIDEVRIKCPCGMFQQRLPDVLDVWIDAGSASWNCLYYPKQEDLFKKWFPADFILEAKEQIRGWFNLLMVGSMLGFDTGCFKNVFMHGMLTDVEGVKMSKSIGNVISPYELMDKYGADTLRYYMCETNAGEDIKFSWDEVKLRNKNLNVLWNIHKFLIDLTNNSKIKPKVIENGTDLEERYIFSKMNSTIRDVTKAFEKYKLHTVNGMLQELFLELSRTYIQLIRDKAAVGVQEHKQVVADTIYTVLLNLVKLMAPSMPYISEMIYLNLRKAYGAQEESVHLCDWPEFEERHINTILEKDMAIVQNIIQAILAGREKMNRGVRWPIGEVKIATEDKNVVKAIENIGDLIKNQTNVKSIVIDTDIDVKISLKANYSHLGKDYGKLTQKIAAEIEKLDGNKVLNKINDEGKFALKVDGQDVELERKHIVIEKESVAGVIESEFRWGIIYIDDKVDEALDAEGFAREVIRRVQSLRKDATLEKADTVDLVVYFSEKIHDNFKMVLETNQAKMGAASFELIFSKPTAEFGHSYVDKVKGKEFGIFFNISK